MYDAVWMWLGWRVATDTKNETEKYFDAHADRRFIRFISSAHDGLEWHQRPSYLLRRYDGRPAASGSFRGDEPQRPDGAGDGRIDEVLDDLCRAKVVDQNR